MRSLFSWAAKNTALSFLLGLEFACLLLGLGWAISVTLNKDEKASIARAEIAEVLIIAEAGLEDFAITEMEVLALSEEVAYKLITTSRENAINEFGKYETAILILSRQLDEKEIADVDVSPDRLPLTQSAIDNSSALTESNPVFVIDNITSVEEDQIVTFLHSNPSQDVVYQKMRSKPSKIGLRNG